MIQAVVFDLFGVLASNQPAGVKAQLESVLTADPDDFWRCYWQFRPGYDTASISDGEYWQQVAAALGARLGSAELATLCRLDDESWAGQNDAVVEFAFELAEAGLPLALLSNIPARLAGYLDRRHGWLELFGVTGLSCRLGVAKPDPRAFAAVVDGLALEPAAVLYIDDRAENVRAASDYGMHVHHFTEIGALRATWHELSSRC